MESMENVPNSQKFSPSQEGEKLRVIPAAVEAGCETMEVSKTPPSPVAMDHQLKGEEVEGDMFEEASLSEEETESKMETESSKPTTMTTAQGELSRPFVLHMCVCVYVCMYVPRLCPALC